MSKHLGAYSLLHGPKGRELTEYIEENIPDLWSLSIEPIIEVANTGTTYTARVDGWPVDEPRLHTPDKFFWFTPHVENNEGAALILNGLPPLPFQYADGTPLPAGYLQPVNRYLICCNGEAFITGVKPTAVSGTATVISEGTYAARSLAKRFRDFPVVDDWRGAGGDTSDIGMINAALVAQRGTVYMLPRPYSIEASIQLQEDTHLIAAGRDATVVTMTGDDDSIVHTAEGPTGGYYNVGLKRIGLVGNANQSYGLKIAGCRNSEFEDIEVSGLTKMTGAGYLGSEAAWAFYFYGYLLANQITRIQTMQCRMTRLLSTGNPNGITNASPDHSSDGGSSHFPRKRIGGLNNVYTSCKATDFKGIGMDVWGEATSVFVANFDTEYDNTIGIRINDAVFFGMGIDCECFTDTWDEVAEGGPLPGGADPEWGFPLGVNMNSAKGFYITEHASGVLILPQGNGNRQRLDFQNALAFDKFRVIGRTGFEKIGGSYIGGVTKEIILVSANTAMTRAHAGQLVRIGAAGQVNYTFLQHSDLPLPIGTTVEFMRNSTGVVEFVAGTGVTLTSKLDYRRISERYGRAIAVKITENNWNLSGDLSA